MPDDVVIIATDSAEQPPESAAPSATEIADAIVNAEVAHEEQQELEQAVESAQATADMAVDIALADSTHSHFDTDERLGAIENQLVELTSAVLALTPAPADSATVEEVEPEPAAAPTEEAESDEPRRLHGFRRGR